MSEIPDAPSAEDTTALTIADAARASGTDRRAIRRLLEAGALPGAFKDEQGFWRILSSELEAAGLALDTAAAPMTAPVPQQTGGLDVLHLTLELARMEARAERAEALLAAESRLNEELRAALLIQRRTLDAVLGPDPSAAPEPRPSANRANWQHELRAARAREQQQRAARAREAQS